MEKYLRNYVRENNLIKYKRSEYLGLRIHVRNCNNHYIKW